MDGPGSKIEDVSQQAGAHSSLLYGWFGRASVDVIG